MTLYRKGMNTNTARAMKSALATRDMANLARRQRRYIQARRLDRSADASMSRAMRMLVNEMTDDK